MPVLSQDLVQANLSINREEVKRRLLSGETLLTEEQYKLLHDVLGLIESVNDVAEELLELGAVPDELLQDGRRAKFSCKATKDAGLEVGEIEWIDN